MGNPLFEAIERLTNPQDYAAQEQVYRNRRDEQQVHYDALGAYRKVSVQETVTPLEVIVIRDADHLREVLDAGARRY